MDQSTVIRAENLTDTHPELPEGWERTIGKLRAYGWPWICKTCEQPSYLSWKCS